MRALPVPRDFAENAAVMTEPELRRHYKRGDQTIRRWINLSGVEPKSKRKTASREWRFVQPDTPEEIKMCLNCKFSECKGWCAKMAASKGGYLDE